VYHKPVPACNFAQTACQAALTIARERRGPPADIASVVVRVPRSGMLYPGCNDAGPFAHVLQAKMSIQYNVAAALLAGSVSERNFADLNDPTRAALVAKTTLQVDDEMTRAYPGKQGGAVEVRERGGATFRARLDDVVNATAADVRARFREAAAQALGAQRTREIEHAIDGLERSDDAGELALLLRPAAD
jgi:2-methylcitrate dehydratase PrpD